MFDYYEKNNGKWIAVTEEKFRETKNPAVCTRDAFENFGVRNIPGVTIVTPFGGFVIRKTFPDGRIVEIPNGKIGWDTRKLFRALDTLATCETLEAYENTVLQEKISELEFRLSEANKEIENRRKENSCLRSEIERMNKKAEDFFSELSTAIEINEKGGPGSRKKVREILENLRGQINVEEEEYFDNEEQETYILEYFSF